MFRRLRSVAAVLFAGSPTPAAVRPLPETVKDLARNRPPFPSSHPSSPFPLVDASGRTWAERRRERDEATKVSG